MPLYLSYSSTCFPSRILVKIFFHRSVFKNSAYCVVCMSETELNPKEKVHRVYRRSKYSPLQVTWWEKYKRMCSNQSWWSLLLLDKDNNEDSTHIRHKPFSLWISTMLTMCLCVGCLNIETRRRCRKSAWWAIWASLQSVFDFTDMFERDISCSCVEYDPLSHVQHVTGLNGHFTQWAHETNKPLITLISENYTQITIWG